ncbi:hypothetical protein EG829_20005 [bacterium]|nr:hypothetical protein [bacterium]
MRSIARLTREGPDSILLDTVLERNFAKGLEIALSEGRIPYRRPWTGFIHVPPEVPNWLEYRKSPKHYFQLPQWRDSLHHCRGLITLSRDLRDWVSEQLPEVPVLALHHPTEFSDRTFDFEAYLRHGEAVVQVGWWLRRFSSIHFLALPRKRKHLLVPLDGAELPRFMRTLEAERTHTNAPPLEQWDATVRPRQSNDDYDELLTRSIVFLDLRAAAANNAVIECIVRRTPVLVRRLPSTREYLGEDYPFFFDSLEEATAKAVDPGLVLQAHNYLVAKDVSFLSGETFCRELAQSQMYQSW